MSSIDVLIKILQICVTKGKECAFLKGNDTTLSSSAAFMILAQCIKLLWYRAPFKAAKVTVLLCC